MEKRNKRKAPLNNNDEQQTKKAREECLIINNKNRQSDEERQSNAGVFGLICTELLHLLFEFLGIQYRRTAARLCHFLKDAVHGYESLHNPKCIFCEHYMKVPTRFYTRASLRLWNNCSHDPCVLVKYQNFSPILNDAHAISLGLHIRDFAFFSDHHEWRGSSLRLNAHNECLEADSDLSFHIASQVQTSMGCSLSRLGPMDDLVQRDAILNILQRHFLQALSRYLNQDNKNAAQRLLVLKSIEKQVPLTTGDPEHPCGEIICVDGISQQHINNIFYSTPWLKMRFLLLRQCFLEGYLWDNISRDDNFCINNAISAIINVPEKYNSSTEYLQVLFGLAERVAIQQALGARFVGFTLEDMDAKKRSLNDFLNNIRQKKQGYDFADGAISSKALRDLVSIAITKSFSNNMNCFHCGAYLTLVDSLDCPEQLSHKGVLIKPLETVYSISSGPEDNYLRCCLWTERTTSSALKHHARPITAEGGVLAGDVEMNHTNRWREMAWTSDLDELKPTKYNSPKLLRLAYGICAECMRHPSINKDLMNFSVTENVERTPANTLKISFVFNGIKLQEGAVVRLQRTLESARSGTHTVEELMKDLYAVWKEQSPCQPNCPLIPIVSCNKLLVL